MTTNSSGEIRAKSIYSPCGKYLDLGGIFVTEAEFIKMTKLVRGAFLTDPPDQEASKEFDEIIEAGIARATSTTTTLASR